MSTVPYRTFPKMSIHLTAAMRPSAAHRQDPGRRTSVRRNSTSKRTTYRQATKTILTPPMRQSTKACLLPRPLHPATGKVVSVASARECFVRLSCWFFLFSFVIFLFPVFTFGLNILGCVCIFRCQSVCLVCEGASFFGLQDDPYMPSVLCSSGPPDP